MKLILRNLPAQCFVGDVGKTRWNASFTWSAC